MPKIAKPKPGPSTQKYLDISEIKEDTMILKDGTLRAVILVSSLNFALKSEDEQNAIINAYMSFLNTLEFPLQIVIQSRKLNIDKYLDDLKEVEKKQTNELLKMQTGDYINFVQELVELGEIMTKKFFVVIPYDPASDKRKGFWKRLKETLTPATLISLGQERFLKRRKELFKRVDHVVSSLNSIGLSAAVLDTQSIIELLYITYNPDVSEREKLAEVGKLRVGE